MYKNAEGYRDETANNRGRKRRENKAQEAAGGQ